MVRLGTAQTALPGCRKTPEKVRSCPLFLNVPDDVKLIPDMLLCRLHHDVEVVLAAAEHAHEAPSSDFIQRLSIQAELFEGGEVGPIPS